MSNDKSFYAKNIKIVNATTNGATNTELVAAKASFSIVVDKIIVSMSAAGNFFLESDGDSDTVVYPTCYIAANSSHDSGDIRVKTAGANEAIDITTSITGDWSVYMEYHYEAA